jgi:predicted ribosome quality control (RQC) complex YloA/Tae2 family protein
MALDGLVLHQLRKEIADGAIGAKVDKVYQPERDEIILTFRSRSGTNRLLISASPNSPRIHFTSSSIENPASPPMFCMLMRKRFIGGRLMDVRQIGLDRVLLLDFDCTNELGDWARLTIAVEIMGRHSNIILIDEHNKILDAIKHIDITMSSIRQIMPGLIYHEPPAQMKLNLLESTQTELLSAIGNAPDEELPKALLTVLQGVSPIVCREISHIAMRGDLSVRSHSLTGELRERLAFFISKAANSIIDNSTKPMIAVDVSTGRPIDFTFMEITQYGRAALTKEYPDFSTLLDDFFGERSRLDRQKRKQQTILKVLSSNYDKLSRKINSQRDELIQCEGRDQLRIFGDLINANIYKLKKGLSCVQLENYYDDNKLISIVLNPMLTPAQNAQHYYRNYRKAHTAEQILKVQIENSLKEIAYIDSVFEELTRAVAEKDLSEIRQELADEGYIKYEHKGKKKIAVSEPIKLISSDGIIIYVGRNNQQNDRLTLRSARNHFMWLHTHNIPGAHVIIAHDGALIPQKTMTEAAIIAATNSKARESSQVPVDYTLVKNIKKPPGAKPGLVTYDNFKTVYVTPDETIMERLKKTIHN